MKRAQKRHSDYVGKGYNNQRLTCRQKCMNMWRNKLVLTEFHPDFWAQKLKRKNKKMGKMLPYHEVLQHNCIKYHTARGV